LEGLGSGVIREMLFYSRGSFFLILFFLITPVF